jgi:acyl-CoA synthetase (AMP-forming)/AMP-acid ligase II
VPSTFARLLALEHLDGHDLSSLRYVTQAGAAMSREMAARVRGAFPGTRLFVMYGQTEASARLAYLPPEDADRKAGSVGLAIPGVELTVRDGGGAPCPPRVVGEVVARGDNITVGYFKNPEATARALRSDGLHTGDLGYMDEEGYLFLVGRESEMIKSGAHRIAPRAIEEVIETLEAVGECAVVGRPDPVLGQAIVAFVVLREGAQLSAKDVLLRCRQELPRFQLPREVRFVSRLPRTDNGKLSRRSLGEQLAHESQVSHV